MSIATKVLAIMLALSVVGNAWFGRAYLDQRDKAVVAKVEERQAVGVSLECSKGTESLDLQAKKREKDAAPKRQAAADKAAVHNRKSDQILATPPAVPGNACASAQAELDSWWETQRKDHDTR